MNYTDNVLSVEPDLLSLSPLASEADCKLQVLEGAFGDTSKHGSSAPSAGERAVLGMSSCLKRPFLATL